MQSINFALQCRNLSQNRLTGPIPISVCILQNLTELFLLFFSLFQKISCWFSSPKGHFKETNCLARSLLVYQICTACSFCIFFSFKLSRVNRLTLVRYLNNNHFSGPAPNFLAKTPNLTCLWVVLFTINEPFLLHKLHPRTISDNYFEGPLSDEIMNRPWRHWFVFSCLNTFLDD